MTDKTKKLWLRRANPGQFFLFVGDDGCEITFRERLIVPEWSCCRTRIENFEIHPKELPHYEVEIKNGFEYVTTRNSFSLLETGPGYRLTPCRPRGADWKLWDQSHDKRSVWRRPHVPPRPCVAPPPAPLIAGRLISVTHADGTTTYFD